MRLDFCAICGIKEDLEQHHWVARINGGSDEETNILTLCGKHHSEIHSMIRKNNISKLTKKGLAKAKANGVQLGKYSKVLKEKNMKEADDFARKLCAIFIKLEDEGYISFCSKARRLNELNIQTFNKKKWHQKTVQLIQERLKKLGLHEFKSYVRGSKKTINLQKNNTSGKTGVTWAQNAKRWVAFIRFNGLYHYLGNFVKKEDAIKAREEAEIKYFGESTTQD